MQSEELRIRKKYFSVAFEMTPSALSPEKPLNVSVGRAEPNKTAASAHPLQRRIVVLLVL
jgi:hypothetical protein